MTKTFHNLTLGANAMIRSNRGVTVLYARGEASVEIEAVIASTKQPMVNASGVTVRTVIQDFIIRAQDIVLGGQAVLPERGDTITMTAVDDDGPSTATIFEVMPTDGERHYRDCNDLGSILRVHTKHVGTEVIEEPA